MWYVKIKMERLSARILLVICGLQLVKCCSLTGNDHVYTGPEFSMITVKNVSDTLKAGDVIVEYTAQDITGVTEISKTDEKFIKAYFDNNKLTFKAISNFPDFELNVTLLQISDSLKVACVDKEYPMNLLLVINDTDNHKPTFSEPNYKFILPMPWPAGISIPEFFEDIWVFDADTTSSLEYNSSDDAVGRFDITFTEIRDNFLPDGSYFKTYYTLDLRPKEALNEPLVLTVTVMDKGSPILSTVTTTITLDRNPKTSTPKSPTFEHHWYLIEMNDTIKENDALIPKDGPIKLETYDDINTVKLALEGEAGFISHFDVQRVNNEAKIILTKKFSDPEPQFTFITVKAIVEKAAQPGYTVLNIIFPPPECPITTTAEPCTTPEIITTTSTTVTTTSSTTRSTDENTSPTSTEDPCSRCPTITTVCPSETTITEPTATTTTHPVSKTTPEVKTTSEDPCSSCPTTISDCPTVTITEATSCPVCNESTTSSTENIWSTDVTGWTSEVTSCPPCDCSSTISSADDSSSATSCPTSEPCPTQEPPAECKLTFPMQNYNLTAHAGYSGYIGHVEASSDPPLNPSYIFYIVLDESNVIVKDFKIIRGNMYSVFPLEAGYRKLSIYPTAKCSDFDQQENATVHLNVYSIDVCGNQTDIEIIFPEGFNILEVYENSKNPNLTPPITIPPSLNCKFTLEVEPKMTEFKIDNNDGHISMDAIDREAEIFHGEIIPEIKLNVTATCFREEASDWTDENSVMDSSTSKSISKIILVHVLDKNDCPPKFTNTNVTIGYPTKSIAEEEMPTQLGIAEAHDADVGENAKFTYHLQGTSEVIIEELSGYYYPHPNFFQYKDFQFTIVAKEGNYYSDCLVKVKILSQKYLTEIRIKGALVDDAQDIVKKISNVTSLDIGIVSAKLVKSYSSEDSKDISFERGIFGNPSYVFTDGMKEISMDDLRADDTYSLRLVVYAFKDGEAVDTNTLQGQLDKIEGPMKAKAYAVVGYTVTDQSSAIIALSVVLALVILGVIGFIVYRFWMKRRNKDNDSLEGGLVDEKNDEMRDDNDFIYKSEKASISSGETGIADQADQADQDDMNPDRRKSVAFAEEAQVIPGDDEETQGNIGGSLIDVKM